MKISIPYLIVVIILSFLLSSCIATTYKVGKEFPASKTIELKVGFTSQTKVIQLFGQPLSKGLINGNDVYSYTDEEYIFETNDYVSRKGNKLVIEFDKFKKVKNYFLNVPGTESAMFGYLMNQRNKEKKNEEEEENSFNVEQN